MTDLTCQDQDVASFQRRRRRLRGDLGQLLRKLHDAIKVLLWFQWVHWFYIQKPRNRDTVAYIPHFLVIYASIIQWVRPKHVVYYMLQDLQEKQCIHDVTHSLMQFLLYMIFGHAHFADRTATCMMRWMIVRQKWIRTKNKVTIGRTV